MAVDPASLGYQTLLLEQGDFAQGTSSRSTKLVHGGVRYLQQGNVALVIDALKERGLLLANAPHLVRNLSFVVPNYEWWEGPELFREDAAYGEALHPSFPTRAGEVVWAARNEMARTVEDVLSRRTRSLVLEARAAMEIAPRVAELMAAELGRDETWRRDRVESFRRLGAGYLP